MNVNFTRRNCSQLSSRRWNKINCEYQTKWKSIRVYQ